MELAAWNSRATAPQQQDNRNSSTAARRMVQQLSLDSYRDILCLLEDFGVVVCKQHCTAVANLNTHLRDQHATPVLLRKQIVAQFQPFAIVNPSTVTLPEQPAWPIQELGTPLDGLRCKTCDFITINKAVLRIHCKKDHQQAWASDKTVLYNTVKVQTLFNTSGRQKYFTVHLGADKETDEAGQSSVVQQQLGAWQETREQLEQDMQVMEDAVKTDKTGWYKRTGWLEHFKDRNLAHLGQQARSWI
jgi:hypothetical protein